MRKFRRKSGAVVTHLSSYEVELLTSLVSQLVEIGVDRLEVQKLQLGERVCFQDVLLW